MLTLDAISGTAGAPLWKIPGSMGVVLEAPRRTGAYRTLWTQVSRSLHYSGVNSTEEDDSKQGAADSPARLRRVVNALDALVGPAAYRAWVVGGAIRADPIDRISA
jgi:hypothetical protein